MSNTLCSSRSIIDPKKKVKLLDQSKSCFKRTINWNKYQSKATIYAPNQYLDYLIDPSQGVNRLFISLFENNAHRTSYKRYSLPIAEKKDYNVMIDRKNFLISQQKLIKEHMITLEKLRQVKEMITPLAAYCIMFFQKIL